MTSARSVARTVISFGLVTVPVSLYKATDDARSYELHQYDAESQSRIRYVKTRESDGAVVDAASIVKGAEIGDRIVTITDEDLASLADLAPSQQAMEVLSFVPVTALNTLLLAGVTYYLAPDSKVKGGSKAFRLLAGAMHRAGRAAVVVWGMRGREHPFVLTANADGVITAQQLIWQSQLRTPPQVEDAQLSATEMDMADSLVQALAADAIEVPETDQYDAALARLIEARAAGTTLAAPAAPVVAPQPDLAAALAASLDAMRGKPRPPVETVPGSRTGGVLR